MIRENEKKFANWKTKLCRLYRPCEQLSTLDLEMPNLLEVAGVRRSQTAEMLAVVHIQTLV